MVEADPALVKGAKALRHSQGIAKRRKRFTTTTLAPRAAKGRWPKGQGWNRGAKAKRKPEAMGDRIFTQHG